VENKVRFALVGAGGIGQSYAQAFRGSADAELVAVADVRAEAARAMAECSGCPSFDSHEAMSADGPGFDAVVVCTPPDTHEEISVHFLEAGVHVLCEKPFALDVAGARRMHEASRRAGVRLTMASKFRYVDDVSRAKSIVASGILGEIILYENAFTSRVNMASRWNARPEVSGGGVLIDNGSHSVDLMRYFLGPLAEVQVVEGKRVQGLAVEETALIFVRSEGGVMGRIDLSWSLSKDDEYYLRIFGAYGTIFVGWKRSMFRQSTSSDWTVFGDGYDKIQALRNQVQNFARAIRGEEMLRITAEDAVASVEVIEGAYKALRRENWLSVGLPPAERPAPAGKDGRNGRPIAAAVP